MKVCFWEISGVRIKRTSEQVPFPHFEPSSFSGSLRFELLSIRGSSGVSLVFTDHTHIWNSVRLTFSVEHWSAGPGAT
jgi:hypothetical protein